MKSYAVIDRIARAANRTDIPYAIVGGTVTSALADAHTFISVDDKELYAAQSSDTNVIRDNGTKRDADILVLSDDAEKIAFIRDVATAASAGQLAISAFGLERYQEPPLTKAARLGNFVLNNYTSSREITADGDVVHRLQPLEAKIPSETLSGWSMYVTHDGTPVPILDPRYHLLCYQLRSVGGLRPKDDTPEKYRAALSRVDQAFESKSPDDLRELIQMSEALNGIHALSTLRAVKEHGAFGFKVKLVHAAEKQMWIVDMFQKLDLETGIFKRFVK
jgi:hypothetical protein